MLIKPKRVLIISSVSPNLDGPGKLSLNVYNALKNQGVDVDLLTKYPVENHPEILYVWKKRNIINAFRERFVYHLIKKQKKGYYFFYQKEKFPPVPTKDVVKVIDKKYDLVYIQFWQGLLSFETVKAIYNKLHCQIHFAGVDYSQMSGGCHFFSDCERYKIGCGKCPAFNSNDINDFTHWNVNYRKKILDEVKPVVYGNTYMQSFYNKSLLLKNVRKFTSSMLIDTNLFIPHSKDIARLNFNIPSSKFVILFGCQQLNDERKGFKYLIESLRIFNSLLREEQHNDILIITIGHNYDEIKHSIPFESRNLGFVSFNKLPLVYSSANIFLSPSVNDAGPMMVNQSLCCGTPVVSFEMGTALDCVKEQGTGYCAELKNSKDFAQGIYNLYSLNEKDMSEISSKCRQFALDNYTEKACVQRIVKAYNKYIQIT